MNDHRCLTTRALKEWSERRTTSKICMIIPTGSIISLSKGMRARKVGIKDYLNLEVSRHPCRTFSNRDPCSNPPRFKGWVTWILMVIIIKKWTSLITIHTRSPEHHRMVLLGKFIRINKTPYKGCKWIREEIMITSVTRTNNNSMKTNITRAWWINIKSMKMNKSILCPYLKRDNFKTNNNLEFLDQEWVADLLSARTLVHIKLVKLPLRM